MPKDLSKMTDAEYKALSSIDLMQYNKSMPEIDYANPYQYQEFPRVMYRKNGNMIEQATFKDAKELKKAGDDWKPSPADFGIQTAPAAPELKITSFAIPITAENSRPPEVKGDAAAG